MLCEFHMLSTIPVKLSHLPAANITFKIQLVAKKLLFTTLFNCKTGGLIRNYLPINYYLLQQFCLFSLEMEKSRINSRERSEAAKVGCVLRGGGEAELIMMLFHIIIINNIIV